MLSDAGLNAIVMNSTTGGSSEKREAWIEKQVEQGVDVLITHPKLVSVGLDLLHFPTIVNYQIGFSIYTLRQAARRSWRIGQKATVRVYFLCYQGTMQEAALKLMSKKMRTSLDTEGILDESALDNLLEDDDTSLAAIARDLILGQSNKIAGALSSVDEDTFDDEYEADITFLPSEKQIEAIINGTAEPTNPGDNENSELHANSSETNHEKEMSLFAMPEKQNGDNTADDNGDSSEDNKQMGLFDFLTA